MIFLESTLAMMVLLATAPVVAGLYQVIVVIGSVFSTHLERSRLQLPRVSILIPAWNEGAVIGATLDRLMRLKYPRDRLRVYVIDDASSDETPDEVIARMKRYPGRVIHVRRVAGGEGKAHTLNYGLEILWRSDWTEAVLIMDADVIYTPSSLLQMARHLADPEVGAVTAYIREGSAAPNLIQRFVTFEYITATGISRRAQNTFGFLACLSGGAQLHSRENLMAIGGEIFSATLAEDTFTTFRTQLKGRRAVFEPNAIVYAEEPDSLVGLWKQRLRWARGNVQITRVFKRLWFQPGAHKTLGSASMGLLWFSIFLMPVLQILAASSLVTLSFIDAETAWRLFRALWLLAGVTYVLVTAVSFAVDEESGRKSWLEGILFPGLVNLMLIVYSLFPGLFTPWLEPLALWVDAALAQAFKTFVYAWLALGMGASWLAKLVEERGWSFLSRALLLLGGYGAFLCAVTFAAYIKEAQGAELKWDKTVKTGKVI